jgi:hypothetical protein
MFDVTLLHRRMAVERTNKDGKGKREKEVKEVKGCEGWTCGRKDFSRDTVNLR